MLSTNTGRFFALLAVAGLALTATAFFSRSIGEEYPLQLNLLRLGIVLSILLTWAHTPGWRGLKCAYLGLLGFTIGGPSGLFLGEALTPNGPDAISIGILMLIGGFWVGAILFAIAGVWWGLWFHRRLDRQSRRKADPRAGTEMMD